MVYGKVSSHELEVLHRWRPWSKAHEKSWVDLIFISKIKPVLFCGSLDLAAGNYFSAIRDLGPKKKSRPLSSREEIEPAMHQLDNAGDVRCSHHTRTRVTPASRAKLGLGVHARARVILYQDSAVTSSGKADGAGGDFCWP